MPIVSTWKVPVGFVWVVRETGLHTDEVIDSSSCDTFPEPVWPYMSTVDGRDVVARFTKKEGDA